jgi:hypothetical protein
MSGHDNAELAALDQIEELLVAYADARLTPTTPVLARIRTTVMAQAAANAAMLDEQRRLDTDRVIGRRWVLPRLHAPSRVMAFGLAAAMTLGTTAAVLAAPPGSPLYGTRVAIENALLPNNADARLAAHEGRITQLLTDAQAAADRGDLVALDAVLTAYQDEVDAAVADLGDAPDRLAHLEDVLGKHVAVLEALEARLPSQAAIERAIEMSQKAVDRLKDKGSHPAVKPTVPPHPSRAPGTDGGGGEPAPTPPTGGGPRPSPASGPGNEGT